jgi:protein tyrosine phosphatase (PTP) superfamily phosphohydrolase (DUF442 family)
MSLRRGRAEAVLLALAWLLPALATGAEPERPVSWARPLAKPGLSNLFEVTPAIFRSAQPDAQGMRAAEALGIKTVLNLRSLHSDAGVAAGTSLRLVDVPMLATHVDRADVLAALRVLADTRGAPILVHCYHGSDRTGLVVAAWRIVILGWPRESAIREMREGGFGFHEEFVNLVEFLRTMDVEWFRVELGISGGREAAPPVKPSAPARP